MKCWACGRENGDEARFYQSCGRRTHRQTSPNPPPAQAAVIALGMAVVYLADPRVQGVYPVCPFFGLTGFHCAGCGTMRALHTLMRGDVAAAIGYNALAMTSLPFIAYSGARAAMSAFGLPSPPRAFIPHRWIWTLLAGVIAFWILRNVPVHPFAALAP